MATVPKQRPVSFSAESVRAILDGRKTQTRRVLKPHPPDWVDTLGYTCFTPDRHISGRGTYEGDRTAEKFFPAAYVVGDLLYVKESFALSARDPEDSDRDTKNPAYWDPPIYKADPECGGKRIRPPWRSPRFMPKWVARIWLEIVSVCAERLQEITEVDARLEGCVPVPCPCVNPTPYGCTDCQGSGYEEPAILEFQALWDQLNAHRPDCAWGDNPYVWRVEFSISEPPQ